MSIFVNELGYLNESIKKATVLSSGTYSIMSGSDNSVIKTFEAKYMCYDKASGDECYIVDFTDITKTGKYYIKGPDNQKSTEFIISDSVYIDIQKAMLKCLYYQRCGIDLEEKYAGVYKHACCHNGKVIHFEDYINKTPSPVMYEMNGGWHDAGDFGRYISPAAVAVGHLLYAYELFPESLHSDLNIPETGNGIDDILNEVRYELDWMLKMQAPDGGVYHKLTAFNHADFIMPENDHDTFLIYSVSSMATADFAASMALASRVYKDIDSDFSNNLLSAARKAFDWLLLNEYTGFKNPAGSNTGEYGDISDKDERIWAAAELLRSDKEGDASKYRTVLESLLTENLSMTEFGWTDVSGFAMLSIHTDTEKSAGGDTVSALKNILFSEIERLESILKNSGYDVAMDPEDYVWGSNMVVANRGMLFVLAAICGDNSAHYKELAENQLNYLLGRNALGRSYITGFGEHAYKNPHNRTSACDGIEEVMPGWVSGGPFKTPVDADAIKIIPKGTPPMKCHADVVGSYSTNEITIYWNSPVIFITAFLNRGL